MAPTWPVPSPETPSVQQTWVPAALKWRVHATLSRSLIMSSLLSTSTRGLLPHHLAIWEWHVDRGILHGTIPSTGHAGTLTAAQGVVMRLAAGVLRHRATRT